MEFQPQGPVDYIFFTVCDSDLFCIYQNKIKQSQEVCGWFDKLTICSNHLPSSIQSQLPDYMYWVVKNKLGSIFTIPECYYYVLFYNIFRRIVFNKGIIINLFQMDKNHISTLHQILQNHSSFLKKSIKSSVQKLTVW